MSNLGFHPQTTVPFSISFNSATPRVTAHSSSGVCQPQKAALTPHFSPPLRSTVCCALVRFPFTTGTFFKQLRALMYQTHLLVTETGKREHSKVLQGNTWHLVWQTLWSATQRLPPLSQEHLQIHKQGKKNLAVGSSTVYNNVDVLWQGTFAAFVLAINSSVLQALKHVWQTCTVVLQIQRDLAHREIGNGLL